MKKIIYVALLAVLGCLFSGCQTTHYRVNQEAVPVDAIETFKQDKAEIPARLQVVNFVVNSVDTDYSDDEKNVFRRHNAVFIPNLLHHSLGERKVFSEVKRSVLPLPESTDYIISGTYDFFGKREIGFSSHSVRIKGTMHLRVVRAKDNLQILDKDFVEERSDEAKKNQRVNVNYLQKAYIESITFEIKKYIAQDTGALRTTAPKTTSR